MPETASNELPELPQWVQDLLEAAEERGYDKGYKEGGRYVYWDMKNQIERVLQNTDPR